MRKTIAVLVAVIIIGPWYGLRLAQAQEEPKESGAAQAKAIEPYRLDFSFNEIEDGKKINTRHYSMDLTIGRDNEIRIGARVPVVTNLASGSGDPQYQIMDIETRISARLERRGDDTELSVNSNTNNLDTTAPASERSAKWLPPVVRQIKIDGRTLLVVGKPIVIGSVDDPNSKRQFQLEVTVTKLALSKESACTFYDRTNNGFEGKCGTKKGDALNAYCTIDANKSSGQTQEGKEGKKLYQLQVGCLGV